MYNCINEWQVDLNREKAKTGLGKNKLTWVYKQEYATEEYIKCKSISYSDRRALAQIRCGSAPLYIY